jgi:hypothetical protein
MCSGDVDDELNGQLVRPNTPDLLSQPTGAAVDVVIDNSVGAVA